MGCEQLVQIFFHMLLNIKLYHWQTTNYARHKASDELHGNLSESIDKFIEVYIGGYDRPKFNSSFSVKVRQLNDDNIKEVLQEYITFLKHELPNFIKESDTHLLNIRDDFLTHINQALYLFTLN
jgi:hypothetical protein